MAALRVAPHRLTRPSPGRRRTPHGARRRAARAREVVLVPDPALLLRRTLAEGLLVVPGCHDPLSARLAAGAGARAVFLAGSAVGRALFGAEGIPPSGADAYLDYARTVCRASPVPVLVDGEDGLGDAVGLAVALADAGAAAVVVGDSSGDGVLRPAEEFAADLAAVRRRTGLVLVARTDGLGHDRADAGRRLARYRAAGADVVFALLTSVLTAESPAEQIATYTRLGTAADGALALHSRRGDELPPLSALPASVALVLLSGLSVPRSDGHIRQALTH